MKLLCCLQCKQAFSLREDRYQECVGQHGGGLYLNDVEVAVWGPRESIQVLAFINSSLAEALRNQVRTGDSDSKMPYAGQWVTVGRYIEAFVVPESSDAVRRFESLHDFRGSVRMPGNLE